MTRKSHRTLRRLCAGTVGAVTALALVGCSLDSDDSGGASTGSGDDEPGGEESTGDESAGEGPTEVLVGVALPTSGPVARTGNLYIKGIELRFAQAAESGELGDVDVTVDVQDDADDPNQAATLVTRFDQDGAVAMFGGHSSPVALAQQESVEAAKLPEFVFGASAAIDSDYQYQLNARDPQQIENVIRFADENGFDSVGFLTDTGAYGSSALEVMNETIGASDLEIVGSETFEPGASNLAPQLVSLRKEEPDFIAMFSFGVPYSAVVQGKAEIGWDVPVIGNVAAGDVAIGEIAGEDADGLYYQSPFGGDSPAAQQLIEDWADAYPDDDLTFEGAMGYDAASLVVRALKESGTTREAVHEWLSTTTEVDGMASGNTPWDISTRRPILAEDLSFRVWENGETVEVDASS